MVMFIASCFGCKTWMSTNQTQVKPQEESFFSKYFSACLGYNDKKTQTKRQIPDLQVQVVKSGLEKIEKCLNKREHKAAFITAETVKSLYENSDSKKINFDFSGLRPSILNINDKDYLMIPLKVGEGGSSNVFIGLEIQSGQIVAISINKQTNKKVFIQTSLNEDLFEKLKSFSIQKDHILPIINKIEFYHSRLFRSKERVQVLISPFCQQGNLVHYLNNHQVQVTKIIMIAKDLFEGLSNLHQAGILHRDIKPENVLIYDKQITVLADFGVSIIKGETGEKLEILGGSTSHLAPEVRTANAKYNEACDTWSLGLVLYYLFKETVHPIVKNLEENPAKTNLEYIADYENLVDESFGEKECKEDPFLKGMITPKKSQRMSLEKAYELFEKIFLESEESLNSENKN